MRITAIKQQVKRSDRYSVFVDEAYVCSLSEAGLIASRLASGQELSEAELQELKETAGFDKAYGNALRYVAMRPRSEWELAEYFRRKGVDEEAAGRVADRLRDLGLLNDVAFARSWVTNRRLLKSVSKRRLRQELQQKHIDSGIIVQVLAQDETNERDTLRDIIARKKSRYPDRKKFMQYLARQGFAFDDIQLALDEAVDEE